MDKVPLNVSRVLPNLWILWNIFLYFGVRAAIHPLGIRASHCNRQRSSRASVPLCHVIRVEQFSVGLAQRISVRAGLKRAGRISKPWQVMAYAAGWERKNRKVTKPQRSLRLVVHRPNRKCPWQVVIRRKYVGSYRTQSLAAAAAAKHNGETPTSAISALLQLIQPYF